MLDIGCGSGILSIAAAKLGAAHVTAVDIDPQAVSATQSNVEINSIDTITVFEGTLGDEAPFDGRFDVIVANISGLAIERLAAVIGDRLVSGGRFIASGFLDEAVETLRAALDKAGLTVDRIDEEGVWRAIQARNDDA